MVSLPTTNELISAFWNISIKEEGTIFSVLNDDHSAFLGDGECILCTKPSINEKRQAAALTIQNCWFKYKRKKAHSCSPDQEMKEVCSLTSTSTVTISKSENQPSFNIILKKFTKSESSTVAASIIQRNFRSFLRRKIFYQLMETLYGLLKTDPIKLLKRVNSIESQLFEKTRGNTLIFRFAGETFPPQIVYKVFTNRSVVNINSSWRVNANYKPKDKNKHNLASKSVTPSDGWKILYSYRKAIVNHPVHQETSKTKQFKYKNNKHYKRSNITWIREMYHLG